MKIVIVGSSHAGITLYDKRNQVSFVSQGIISYLAGQKSVLNQSSYSSVEELKAAGLNMQMETVVEEIDTKINGYFIGESIPKRRNSLSMIN